METFIVENFMNKRISLNCGEGNIYTGIVKSCIKHFISLETEHGVVHISINKIISIKER